MKKKVITIWGNKANRDDWLKNAGKMDCKYRDGYEEIGYIGYNIRTANGYTHFESENAWGRTVTTTVLTKNIEHITDYIEKQN